MSKTKRNKKLAAAQKKLENRGDKEISSETNYCKDCYYYYQKRCRDKERKQGLPIPIITYTARKNTCENFKRRKK